MCAVHRIPRDRRPLATILPRVVTRGAERAIATARLGASADPTAALDADLLLAHATGTSKESLYAHLDVPLAADELVRYRDLVERRASGEPVAYLRGHKDFFGLRFAVDRRVLIPRPETEILVESVLAFLRATGRTRVVDVGTGSGAIAIAIAVSEPRARVIATDLAAGALEVARTNALVHGVADRIDLRQGDLLASVSERVDVVAANLPYLRDDAVREWTGDRTSLAFEPAVAVVAGADGLALIRRCVDDLARVLVAGGAAYFECDPPQADTVRALVGARIGAATRVIPDLSGAPRVVEGIVR
jgi:release factor glutamine methyltransferase